MASHFARLRLLDPDRFFDLNEFLGEASITATWQSSRTSFEPSHARGKRHGYAGAHPWGTEESVQAKLEKMERGESRIRDEFIDALLDQHGTAA
jgi:ATP-dependent helicase HepA